MLNEKQTQQTKNSLPAEVFTNPGDRIQPIYTRVYDADRKKEIVKHTSDTDIYELIQESDNSSDITLLKKMINGGSMEAPEDPLAQYGLDLANMPKNIHDVYDTANDGIKAFNNLPDYLQKELGSPEGMKAALLNGSYNNIVDQAIAKQYKAAQAAAVAAQEGDSK